MTNDKQDPVELKKQLVHQVIVACGGAKNVVRYNLWCLWQRHGKLIAEVITNAALDEATLRGITETALHGEFAELIDFAPRTTDRAKIELFHAAATIAAAVLKEIQKVELSPRTITGTPPPPRALVPIYLIGVVPAESPPPSPPAQKAIIPVSRLKVRYELEVDPPQQRRGVRGNILTVMLRDGVPWSEKRVTLTESLHSLVRWLMLILPALAGAFAGFWYGVQLMAKLMQTAGIVAGFALSLVLFCAAAGIIWWSWTKIGDRLVAWAKQPKEGN